jgi:hypothetical protein
MLANYHKLAICCEQDFVAAPEAHSQEWLCHKTFLQRL